MAFKHTLWVNRAKSKQSNQNYDTIHFENAIYMALHERSNNTVSFTWHLNFQEKMTYTHSLDGKSGQKRLEKTSTHLEGQIDVDSINLYIYNLQIYRLYIYRLKLSLKSRFKNFKISKPRHNQQEINKTVSINKSRLLCANMNSTYVKTVFCT